MSPRTTTKVDDSQRATAASPRQIPASSSRTTTTASPTNTSSSSPLSGSSQRIATSPRGTSANNNLEGSAGSGLSPRKKFDPNTPYDNTMHRRYQDEHQRPSMPEPPRGQVGERYQIPASVREFTAIKTIQEPEQAKVGVYLGPQGKGGGVWSSQMDVRRRQEIGGPEVSTKAHIGSAATIQDSVTVRTAGSAVFEERYFANTNCQDIIASVVKKLGLLYPASNFGLIQKTSAGDSWVAPDKFVHELGKGPHLVVVPKQNTAEEIKKAYFGVVSARKVTPSVYESDSNFTPEDVQTAPNQGKQLYYADK